MWLDLFRVPPSGTWERQRRSVCRGRRLVGALARARRGGPRAARPPLSRRLRTRCAERHCRLGRPAHHDRPAGSRTPEAAPLSYRRRRRAGRSDEGSAARPRDAGPGQVPAGVGCDTSCSCPSREDPVRGVSLAGLQHQDATLGTDVFGRRRSGRDLEARGGRREAGAIPSSGSSNPQGAGGRGRTAERLPRLTPNRPYIFGGVRSELCSL